MPITQTDLDAAFAKLEAAALAGERCPPGAREGFDGLPNGATNLLAKAGRIKVEIYCHNWRVIEILIGPNTGMRTAPCPHKHNGPYLVIGRERVRKFKQQQTGAPSAPRPLTPAQLDRIR